MTSGTWLLRKSRALGSARGGGGGGSWLAGDVRLGEEVAGSRVFPCSLSLLVGVWLQKSVEKRVLLYRT